MSSETRIRTDRFSVEWHYAKQCWDALVAKRAIPPIPNYSIYESKEGQPDRLVGAKPISPKRVSYGGVTVFG